ncbi:MAG: ATP-binding protein [Bacteroidales bacterium]
MMMSFSIAIASGKGGTGKTTVAVSLFNILSRTLNVKVQLIDCDVEEPNDTLFFPDKQIIGTKAVCKLIPVINKVECSWCRRCSEYCEFNAIVILPMAEYAEINPGLCHSCGACLVACEDDAISEISKPIGEINTFALSDGSVIKEGILKIGSAMQTMLIRELKKNTNETADITIYDAPPGTSCPAVEAVADADYVVLVAEPTPFGLHDLKLMTRIITGAGIPFGVVVNKAGQGDDTLYRFLEEQQIEIIGKIPFSRDFAAAYAKGEIHLNLPSAISVPLDQIALQLTKRIVS